MNKFYLFLIFLFFKIIPMEEESSSEKDKTVVKAKLAAKRLDVFFKNGDVLEKNEEKIKNISFFDRNSNSCQEIIDNPRLKKQSLTIGNANFTLKMSRMEFLAEAEKINEIAKITMHYNHFSCDVPVKKKTATIVHHDKKEKMQ